MSLTKVKQQWYSYPPLMERKLLLTQVSEHTHTQRCALAWGFAAVKGVGNGLLRVLLRLLLRVGNVKGAVCGGPVGRTCAGWLTDVCEDVKVGG